MEMPSLVLRYMALEDVQEVHALDTLAFPTPWPMSTYRHEVSNHNSLMFVLEAARPVNGHASEQPGLLRRLLGSPQAERPNARGRLVGYSGMWHVADEAHISTIAVHPDWQGHKLGELLLWNMLRHAYGVGASMVTLEVRVTNNLAQNLYHKYHFEIVGRRRGYYRDNGEDAYLMSVQPLDEGYEQWLRERGANLAAILPLADQTQRRHPTHR